MKDNEFVGGKLKIKGLRIKKKNKKKKREIKSDGNDSKSMGNNENKYNNEYFTKENKNVKTENKQENESLNKIDDEDKKLKEILESNLTEAEKAYKLVLKKREKQRIEKILQESYRERLQKFNDNLASLSEHFDIPKVGPG
ncbi:conserved Plasmodium protein, unknown function [Plasmodium relictum]|uniref:Uncharacterized protein n=1 Tax=Plasmodium relictum TaxID=85471 RepID=A0A1J1HCD2_PLARL|nr:conserved Plasmodium protein, unknown function [Plasmodium relictum]CRH02758.1 conserved Plasmodium protein, unknown function [Plasmodium relictum]